MNSIQVRQSLNHLVQESASQMKVELVQPCPDLTRLHQENCAWVQEFELIHPEAIKIYEGIRVAACAAQTYGPIDSEVVRLGADLIGWLFLFDDRYGEGPAGENQQRMMEQFASFEQILYGGSVPRNAGPFHRALANLVMRGLWRGGETWQRRFAGDIRRYLDGCLLELPFRRSLDIPSLQDYRNLRQWSIGTLAVFDLVELALPRPLTEDEAGLPELQAAKQRAALLTAWVNDVYSFPKESRSGDPLNLVTSLIHQNGISVEEAFNAASQLYNQDLQALETETAAAIAHSPNSPVLRPFIQGLYRWVHGNYLWTASCGRYA